jgi:precorrin-6A/cobalt-precorrin-6A reductase
VLVLGGTTEARLLADLLAGEGGAEVVTSLAGRTAGPRLPAGPTRTGGFGGADGLTVWLREQRIHALVDATHPFAAGISVHAADAARRAGIPLLVLRRPGWTAGPGDRWHWTDTLAGAAALLPALGSRAFLTTGRQDLAAFAALDAFCLIRCVEPPVPPLPRRHRVVLARGPFTLSGERELLREHRIDVLVTKDSGGAATASKLTAARESSLPVLIVRRPAAPPGVEVAETPSAAARWLRRTV